MTDSRILSEEGVRDALGWRAMLKRRVRRHRAHAARDAVIGAVLCLLVVAGLHGADEWQRAEAQAAQQAAAADAVDAEATPAAASEDVRFSAAMVGDVMFARHVEEVIARRGAGSLLAHVTPHLQADYVSANLEQVVSPRVDELPEADKIIHLGGPPEPLDALVEAGFTLVTLANNHTMDHGLPGLQDTIAAVEAAGLAHVGAGEDLQDAARIHYEDHGDLTVATLSFTDSYVEGFIARAFQGGALGAGTDMMTRLVQEAAGTADLVIAQFHWGDEYDFAPNQRQRDLAEEAALAGADIVVGHHPHVLKPVEMIGSTVVMWSLGNFIFDQGWTRTRESAIARYELGDDGIARLELVPVYIREATPRPLAEGVLGEYRRWRIFSQLRGDGLEWRREGGSLVADIDHRHLLDEGLEG
jgi:gamma-polyglutamate biosynthesis protein CapA